MQQVEEYKQLKNMRLPSHRSSEMTHVWDRRSNLQPAQPTQQSNISESEATSTFKQINRENNRPEVLSAHERQVGTSSTLSKAQKISVQMSPQDNQRDIEVFNPQVKRVEGVFSHFDETFSFTSNTLSQSKEYQVTSNLKIDQ